MADSSRITQHDVIARATDQRIVARAEDHDIRAAARSDEISAREDVRRSSQCACNRINGAAIRQNLVVILTQVGHITATAQDHNICASRCCYGVIAIEIIAQRS